MRANEFLAEKWSTTYKRSIDNVAEGGAETSWSDDTDTITLQDILELTKNIKQINLPINDNLKNKLIHWDGNPEEMERVNQVIVSNQFPILIMVDEQGQIEWILDGNHRLHRAIQSQAKTIPAKLIKPSDLSDKAKKIFQVKEQDVAENFANSRKKNKSINEATKVGREWQHLEDLVFVDGSQGALQAAKILQDMGSGSTALNIKWDGRIAVYWGREPDGTFVLVGKNGWGKDKYTSPEEMQTAITTAGKGEDWRQKLGADMAQVFAIMERNTPANFKGYAFGDLLWYPGEPFTATKEGISFTPNKVTYTVNTQSELGKRVARSSVGIAAHLYYKNFGDSEGTPLTDVTALNSNDAIVLNSRITSYQTKIDTSAVNEIVSLAKAHANEIDGLLAPQPGLSDMKNIIYTYVNQMSRAGRLSELATGFTDWLKTSKVSPQKQTKILAMPESKSIPLLFDLVLKVQSVKNDIIDQLDQQTADITASTEGQPGGEGYAANIEKVKLVPRHRWTPS